MRIDRLKVILVLIAVVSAFSYSKSDAMLATPGGESGSGGGVAEKNISFAYINLGVYIDICLASESCHLTTQETPVLQAIRSSLNDEQKNPEQLIFENGSDYPGFFFLDGAPRVARTDGTIGSNIYYNREFLYPKDAAGNIIPFSVADGVGSLVHELGHHHGIADHTFLDLLGSKVERLLQSKIHQIDFGRSHSEITVKTIDLGFPGITQLTISDSFDVNDLTAIMTSYLGTMCGKTSQLIGVYFSNLHWSGDGYAPMIIVDSSGTHVNAESFTAAVSIQCLNSSVHISNLTSGHLIIQPKFNGIIGNPSLKLDPSGTVFKWSK